MYNLRVRKLQPVAKEVLLDESVKSVKKRKSADSIEEDDVQVAKHCKTDDNPLYDPALFTGGNSYVGIVDSSDSESDDDFEYIKQPSVEIRADRGAVSDDECVINATVNVDDINDEDDNDSFVIEDDEVVESSDDNEPELPDEDEFMGYPDEDDLFDFPRVDTKNAWKTGLAEEEIAKLEPLLENIRTQIKNDIPTIAKILNSGMTQRAKAHAVSLYDIMISYDTNTPEYMQYSALLSELIRLAPEHVDPTLSDKEEQIVRDLDARIPTRERIMQANITEKDRRAAYRMFQSMNQYVYLSSEWMAIQDDINAILDKECASKDDLDKLVADEVIVRQANDATVDYKQRILQLDAEDYIKRRLLVMYDDMINRPSDDSERMRIRDKLRWATEMPYRRVTVSRFNLLTPDDIREYCRNAYRILDSTLYGMREAKQEVVQCLNDRIYNPNSKSILALRGKPGVGKTQLAKSIAQAAGLPFAKISLGGTVDSSIFKGSSSSWVGGAPSMILQILAQVKSANTVVLLDEIDKLGTSPHGLEVQHALLHILDPSQSKDFQDAFLCDFPHDISKIWFIPTMNDDITLDAALRDRLHIVDINPYNRDEMVEIIKLHTLPDTLADKGIGEGLITISDVGARKLLSILGKDVELAGMRPVERAIKNMVSKINMLRTLTTGDNSANDISLTYKLPDFNGFPYVISESTVDALIKVTSPDVSLHPMYT